MAVFYWAILGTPASVPVMVNDAGPFFATMKALQFTFPFCYVGVDFRKH